MKLVEYQQPHEKIILDYLSFMPSERDLSHRLKTLQRYEKDSGWQLYLCCGETGYTGMIGIELSEHTFCVHHISVDPASRNEGIGNAMVIKIQQLHEPLALSTTAATKDFLAKCWERQQNY